MGRHWTGVEGEADQWEPRRTLLAKVLRVVRESPRAVRGADLITYLAVMFAKSSRGLRPDQGPPVPEAELLEWIPAILIFLHSFEQDLREEDPQTSSDAAWALGEARLGAVDIGSWDKVGLARLARGILDASMASDASIPGLLRAAVEGADPEERIRALRTLEALAATRTGFPFEAVVIALRGRSRPGPTMEREQRVLQVVRATLRQVAIARARREGLRVPRPQGVEALAPRDLCWLVIERMWDAATIHEGRAASRSILDLATPGQEALYAIWWTLSEVDNGGFAQYFSNSTCVVAPEALRGFRLIGAEAHAAALGRVLQVFGDPPADDRDEREALIEGEVAGLLEDSSQFFYAAHGLEDVQALAAAWVLAHPQEFFFSP